MTLSSVTGQENTVGYGKNTLSVNLLSNTMLSVNRSLGFTRARRGTSMLCSYWNKVITRIPPAVAETVYETFKRQHTARTEEG